MSDNTKSTNPFRKFLIIAVIVDLIWAFLIATFGATILSQIGLMGGADAGATTTISVVGWIIAFIVAFIQGAIFIGVVSFIVAIFKRVFSNSGGF